MGSPEMTRAVGLNSRFAIWTVDDMHDVGINTKYNCWIWPPVFLSFSISFYYACLKIPLLGVAFPLGVSVGFSAVFIHGFVLLFRICFI